MCSHAQTLSHRLLPLKKSGYSHGMFTPALRRGASELGGNTSGQVTKERRVPGQENKQRVKIHIKQQEVTNE